MSNLNILSEFTLLALEPVWVSNTNSKVAKVERKGRAQSGGPNGESPDSGKWKLRFPDGTIYNGPTLSASALETAKECERKWSLSRLDNLEKPSNAAAERGGLCHTELEHWLKYGKRPEIEGMAAVLEQFPMPGECTSEDYFGFVFGRPGRELVFAGYLDARESIVGQPPIATIYDENGCLVQDGIVFNSTIRDLKTTGDWRWVKTAEQLLANIQAALYVLGEIARIDAASLGPAEGVILKWTYALVKTNKDGSPRITRVQTIHDDDTQQWGVWMSREQAIAVVAQYLPLAEALFDRIIRHESGDKTAADTEKNYESCSMYGGCPWKKENTDSTKTAPACIPAVGGGFKSLLKQDRARVVAADSKKTGENKMTMGSRFGKKLASTPDSNAAAAAVTPPANATVAADKPAATASALGSRFGKKVQATNSVAVATENKLDVKATETGMASKAATEAPAQAGALMNRLQTLNKNKAAAVADAVANAPSHAVTDSVSASVAVGINPPDAAPEWTPEQQEAESRRLAGEKVVGAVAEPAKKARGRPKGNQVLKGGSVDAVLKEIESSGIATGDVLQSALSSLDSIVEQLMGAGYRREAAIVLDAGTRLTGGQ